MAKKQVFGQDKTAAKRLAKNSVKIIVSEKTGRNGAWRFSERMVRVPDGQNFEKYCDSIVSGN